MDDASHPDPRSRETASQPPHAPGAASRSRGRWWGSGSARRARLTFEAPRLPETTSAWLHIVSGPSPRAVARGALELAARFLAGGERVLIVDGGPRLDLHDRFDREVRWGVVECLTGEMPVLGLVQDVGRPNLYLLAHGLPARRTHWPQLGRMMDEARPHFDRAVLALEHDAPSAIGEALAGWHLEGWWVERGRATPRARRLADRLEIHLSDLSLDAMPEVKLEALEVRLRSLTAPGASAGAAPAPTDLPDPATAPTPAAPGVVPSLAASVDCDARVRERLRFLLWMRRIHAEGRSADAADAALGAGAPTA